MGSVALSLLMATTGALGAGPFSREQRPVDVLRTRIGEGGTGGREPSVWPVITPTGAKTPPVGTSPPGPQWLPRSCAAASLWS